MGSWAKWYIMILCGSIGFVHAGCCASPTVYKYAKVVGVMDSGEPAAPTSLLTAGETVVIDDLPAVQKLASFFPGMGSGRRGMLGIKSPKELEIIFMQESGRRVSVYTRLFKYWGSDVDQGDLLVCGDLKSYLQQLLGRTGSAKSVNGRGSN